MKKRFIALLCLVSTTALAGCTAARVAFPEGSDSSGFEQYDVKGRRAFALFSGTFSFGPYMVEWKRGAVFTRSSKHKTMLGEEDTLTSSEEYTVSVSGGGKTSWEGVCKSEAEFIRETKKSKNTKTVSTQVIRNTLACNLKSSDKRNIAFSLIQDEQGLSLYSKKSGDFKLDKSGFRIESTNQLQGSPLGSNTVSGYYIYESGRIVAVIEVMNDGRVYLAKGLEKDKTTVLAAVSAVLLGYKDIME